jgi:hypothetical protein
MTHSLATNSTITKEIAATKARAGSSKSESIQSENFVVDTNRKIMNAALEDATDRVITYFSISSCLVSNEEKALYLSSICEDYVKDYESPSSPSMFSMCVSKMVMVKRLDLYRTVFPVVKYK